eukprot:174925_1
METLMTLTCSCVHMLTMLTPFLPLHIIVQASYDYNNWIGPSSPTMPRVVYAHAVGYDSINNRIWIVGGVDTRQSLISYDIDSNLFSDYNATALSNDVWGSGDFYTQIDDILYMIDRDQGDKLSTLNVNTAQFTFYYQNIDIPYTVLGAGCLASIDNALFVLGSSTRVQV